MCFSSNMVKWAEINLPVIPSDRNLCRAALSSTDFPCRPAVSYADYQANHVRLTRMGNLLRDCITAVVECEEKS